jgi:hypothetical protein
MKVTRDVITDLMPAYLSGEASADTRALVDEFFASDPQLREIFTKGATEKMLESVTLALPPDHEKQTVDRARRLLRLRDLLMAVTIVFICIPFSFRVSDEGFRPVWGNLPKGMYAFAGAAFVSALAWVIIDRMSQSRHLSWLRSLVIAMTMLLICVPFSFSVSDQGFRWIWGELPREVYIFAGLAYVSALGWLLLDYRLRRLD